MRMEVAGYTCTVFPLSIMESDLMTTRYDSDFMFNIISYVSLICHTNPKTVLLSVGALN